MKRSSLIALALGGVLLAGVVIAVLAFKNKEAVLPSNRGASSADKHPEAVRALPETLTAALEDSVAAYTGIAEALAKDDLPAAALSANALAETLRTAVPSLKDQPVLSNEVLGVVNQAQGVHAANDLKESRQVFQTLSEKYLDLISRHDSLKQKLKIFECPMVEGFNQWIQTSGDLKNPYMGSSMQTCGSESTWEPGHQTSLAQAELGTGGAHDEVAHYTCPMHPSVKENQPGQCPICGMDLVPVSVEEVRSGIVRIDEGRMQKIGVRIGEVIKKELTTPIRAVGRITYDESKLQDITLKFSGWISNLNVNETGQFVKKGQPLFSIYSPALYSAQQEYIQAVASQAEARESGAPARADYLVNIAKKKLRLWDISESQLRAIAEGKTAQESLPILSPVSGYVIEKNVVEGASVEPGQRLFRIVGLDKVWINAEVYESDLPLIKVGQTAKVLLPYQADQSYTGTVEYIYPYLDKKTRTGKIRIEIENPDLELKPEMYANVEIAVDRGERLLVPQEAIIYTGPRRLVFVDLGEGRLQPTVVKVGLKSDGYYEILEGLEEGDRVVTSGNFLIGAESRLSSAAKYWSEDGDDEQ